LGWINGLTLETHELCKDTRKSVKRKNEYAQNPKETQVIGGIFGDRREIKWSNHMNGNRSQIGSNSPALETALVLVRLQTEQEFGRPRLPAMDDRTDRRSYLAGRQSGLPTVRRRRPRGFLKELLKAAP
jgi:hypothetical protein